MNDNQSANSNWRLQAACRGMDVSIFVPDSKGWLLYIEARIICETCTVRQPCLDYAMSLPDTVGMFGGLTPEERKLLRRSTA